MVPMLWRRRTATHADPGSRDAPSPSHWYPVQASLKSQNSAGSSSNLLYSLRMMSIARGGFCRHLGSIVTLDRLLILATVGAACCFLPWIKRRFNARFCAATPAGSLAEWREVLRFSKLPNTLHGPTDGWCVEEPGQRNNPLLPLTLPSRHLLQSPGPASVPLS